MKLKTKQWQISFPSHLFLYVGCDSSSCDVCSGPWYGSETNGPTVCRYGCGHPVEASCPGPVGGSSCQPHGDATSTCSENCEYNVSHMSFGNESFNKNFSFRVANLIIDVGVLFSTQLGVVCEYIW